MQEMTGWSHGEVVVGSMVWHTGSLWDVGARVVGLSPPCDRIDGSSFSPSSRLATK